jgi:hypothetical protein
MDPTAPPAKPVKPPKRRSRLEQLVTQHAAATHQAANRLRNWVSFMVFAGALTRATDENEQPLFWFKGGLTMEARFPGPARTTRDVDAIFRLNRPAVDLEGEPMVDREGEPVTGIDPSELLAALERALDEPYHGFTFEVEDPQRVGGSVFYATRIKMQFAGSAWGSVEFEASPPEGSASRPEQVAALPLHFAGLDGPHQLPCLPISYQIAQKLHAVCQQRTPPKENHRERDLIDLLLLRTLIKDFAAVRIACLEIFDERARKPLPPDTVALTWPPTVIIQDGWRARYRALATEFGFAPSDVEQAAAQVQEFIEEIDDRPNPETRNPAP